MLIVTIIVQFPFTKINILFLGSNGDVGSSAMQDYVVTDEISMSCLKFNL